MPNTQGLADVVAGETSVSSVHADGNGLFYRGYAVEELAANCRFEEVAFLLLHGKLPNPLDLKQIEERLHQLRILPEGLKNTLELIPATAHPMDVLRTGCSMLGCLEPERGFEQQMQIAYRLLALFPGMLMYWYQFHRNGKRIDIRGNSTSIAGNFLELLTGDMPQPLHLQAMDCSLILYAEHEFNASTFTARVTSSTLSDFYSAITAGIGTLRGALHGGANEAAMELIERYQSAAEARQGIHASLQKKEKIMGFGHRVYKSKDPRNAIIKQWAKKLGEQQEDQRYYAVSETIEEVMWNEKMLFPNLDFYSASAYYFMGIPVPLYTPIFVFARTAGWSAHVMEQRAHNRLIRPMADYVGEPVRHFVKIEDRA